MYNKSLFGSRDKIISFFTVSCNNKLNKNCYFKGFYTKRNADYIYDELMIYFKGTEIEKGSLAQKYYHLYFNLAPHIPKCIITGVPLKFVNFQTGYRKTSSKGYKKTALKENSSEILKKWHNFRIQKLKEPLNISNNITLDSQSLKEKINKVLLQKNNKFVHWIERPQDYKNKGLIDLYSSINNTISKMGLTESQCNLISFKNKCRLILFDKKLENILCSVCKKIPKKNLNRITCGSNQCISTKAKENKIYLRLLPNSQTPEARRKRVLSRKWYIQSEETKKRISEANKKTWTPERKQQQVENNRKNGVYDRMSKNLKEKIRKGEFTPAITNSWCHGRIYLTETNQKYRSSWEAIFHLLNPLLEFEKQRIPYIFENKSHIYITDFIDNENKIIYEIKPSAYQKCLKLKLKCKIDALNNWCHENNFTFSIIDERYFYNNKIKILTLLENIKDNQKLKRNIRYLLSRSQKEEVKEIKEWEILSENGWQSFSGIKKTQNQEVIELSFENQKKLKCTPNHLLLTKDNHYIEASKSNNKDIQFFTKEPSKVIDIQKIEKKEDVFDILSVNETNNYVTNNVISHNCNLINEFWQSTIPVISSSKKAKIFAVSSARGTGNKFHEVYSAAERKENNWKAERVDWWEIPGRNEKWKQEQLQILGSKDTFDQEFGNSFLELGQTPIDAELIEEFKTKVRKPKILLEDGNYKIFKEPVPDHTYSIGVDVGEGIGQAASVIQIFDITDLTNIEQAAVFHNNKLDPHTFAGKLFMIANQWGKPPLLVERNNSGGQVIDALLHTYGYNNLVDFLPARKKQTVETRRGIYAHVNSRYKGIMNWRYWTNTLQSVHIWDIATIQEMETFVRHPNGTWKKMAGNYQDDRVLAMVWCLFILETDIAEKYLEVVSHDEKGKPQKIAPLEVAEATFFRLDRSTEANDEDSGLNPIYFGIRTLGGDNLNPDVDELLADGWAIL